MRWGVTTTFGIFGSVEFWDPKKLRFQSRGVLTFLRPPPLASRKRRWQMWPRGIDLYSGRGSALKSQEPRSRHPARSSPAVRVRNQTDDEDEQQGLLPADRRRRRRRRGAADEQCEPKQGPKAAATGGGGAAGNDLTTAFAAFDSDAQQESIQQQSVVATQRAIQQ